MKARSLLYFFSATCLFVVLIAAGCSSKSDILKEVSGSWHNPGQPGTVDINLVGSNQSMKVDGKSYPITVEKIRMDDYVVNLKVQNGGSQPETWTLREVWNDNGTDFKLAFNHNGKSEMLVPVKKS